MSPARPVMAKYLGTLIARLIVRGMVHEARRALGAARRPAWRVCELRAIIGACRFANLRYGARLDWQDWLAPAFASTRTEVM